jgi:peptidoglycan/LPS O-acetylase OafA/YrhL
MRYTGKISYGLYLVHMPLFLSWRKIVIERNLPLQGTLFGHLCSVAIAFALAFILASISWKLLESPLLRLKKYFPSGSAFQRPSDELEVKANTPPTERELQT